MNNSQFISIVIPVASATEQEIGLLFQQRAGSGPLAGLWEFPGGKIEPGETPEQAARREFLEECDIELGVLIPFKFFKFSYGAKNLCFYTFLTRDIQGGQFREFNFDRVEKSQKYKDCFPGANYGLIDEVIEYLARQVKSGDFEKIWT